MCSWRRVHHVSRAGLSSTILILENDVAAREVSRRSRRRRCRSGDIQGVDDSGNVTKDGQQKVDEEVSTATTLEEDTKRREDDGDDDLDDVAESMLSARVAACVPLLFRRPEPAEGKGKMR